MPLATLAFTICLLLTGDTPKPQTVSFKTSDGITIEADYYAPKPADNSAELKSGDAKADDKTGEKPVASADARNVAKHPVAILIHMYPADRTSWAPLVPKLHDAGFAVLAYDIRGKGGSSGGADSKLARQYADRDESLFADAWKDCEAAKKWLTARPECDTTRLVCIGASIGCSISIQYGAKDKDVKAVVCLSPGTNYFGVDSVAHIKKLMPRDALLIAPEGEYAAVTKLIQASGDKAVGGMFPGGRERHGTNLFAPDYRRSGEIMDAIIEFVTKATKK
ncbi:MAG: hypothetical protein HBSAPP02_10260 [Phycisphaerae bacterium]|nr:MAG: alpha/beta fold hydrolase [Planctomycetia bacterium]RIK66985.1 MAG: hypothetical protein DCC66_12325 [Planctomycetota bacterium]GJQ25994.1 MAG: hypothetical protein HBSAPP02_10260 [Phycisphaerae bacterium]